MKKTEEQKQLDKIDRGWSAIHCEEVPITAQQRENLTIKGPIPAIFRPEKIKPPVQIPQLLLYFALPFVMALLIVFFLLSLLFQRAT